MEGLMLSRRADGTAAGSLWQRAVVETGFT